MFVAGRSAHAQNVGAGSAQAFGALQLSTGMAMMSVDALNSRMTPSQFAGLSNDAVSYGVSGYFAYGRALLYVRQQELAADASPGVRTTS